jgi:hypothetical protein
MGLWLTEKIGEKTSIPLKIKSIPHSEATPYHSTRYRNQEIIEALSFGLISLRNR